MPYDGDMTVTLSGLEIGSIVAYDSNEVQLTDVHPTSSSLTVYNLLHAQDYWFTIEGAAGVSTGTFDLEIVCSSDSPTNSPSSDSTRDPTSDPTVDPTTSPSADPTSDPTA